MTQTSIFVHANPDVLAQAAAARLIVRIIDAQAERGRADLVLTGGRIARQVYQAVRDSPARAAVDWSQVDVWWGDERFLPTGHPERNETLARSALLDDLALDPARIHPMPACDAPTRPDAVGNEPNDTGPDGNESDSNEPDGNEPDGHDPEAAAARYADELARAARPGTARLPHFDLLLLSIGEDGHVAALFPEQPAVYEARPVAAVRGSPKPPAVRLTMTLPTINSAEEIWILGAGADKAGAVGMALTGPGAVQLPAAGVRGVERTLWLLDRAAAVEVSPRLRSLR